jgi:hypothetical protein
VLDRSRPARRRRAHTHAARPAGARLQAADRHTDAVDLFGLIFFLRFQIYFFGLQIVYFGLQIVYFGLQILYVSLTFFVVALHFP